MEIIIGIDLISSNITTFAYRFQSIELIPMKFGASSGCRSFPPFISLSGDGKLLLGDAAKRKVVTSPQSTLGSPLRMIGTDFKFTFLEKEMFHEQILALILRSIKKEAEDYLKKDVEKAVLAIPQCYGFKKRARIEEAAKIAGFTKIRSVGQSLLGSLMFTFHNMNFDGNIISLTIGSDFAEASVIETSRGVAEVLSVSCDLKLGENSIDKTLTNLVINKYKEQEKFGLNFGISETLRLMEECEEAKIDLNQSLSTEIFIPNLFQIDDKPKDLRIGINRVDFENAIKPIIDKILRLMDDALSQSFTTKEYISKIIISGRGSRLHSIRAAIEGYFGIKVNPVYDPSEIVAEGAALLAGVLQGDIKNLLLLNSISLDLYVQLENGEPRELYKRNLTIPTFKTIEYDNVVSYRDYVTFRIFEDVRDQNEPILEYKVNIINSSSKKVNRIIVKLEVDSDSNFKFVFMNGDTMQFLNFEIISSVFRQKEIIEEMKVQCKKIIPD